MKLHHELLFILGPLDMDDIFKVMESKIKVTQRRPWKPGAFDRLSTAKGTYLDTYYY